MARFAPAAAAAALLSVAAAAAAQTGPELTRVTVDCDTGGSVAQALGRPGRDLEISIRGFCEESVEVRRDRVVLAGADPLRDGLRAPADGGPTQAALVVRGASGVRVASLGLAGGAWAGLRVVGALDPVTVDDVRVEGNGQWGVEVLAGAASFTRLVAVGNGDGGRGGPHGGLLAQRGAAVTCLDCLITDNPRAGDGLGAVALSGSTVAMRGGAVEGAVAVLARLHASVTLVEVELAGVDWAFQASYDGRVRVTGGAFAGAFLASTQSGVELFGTEQTVNPALNFVTESSQLVVDDRAGGDGEEERVATRLAGPTMLTDFSTGKLLDSTVAGDLSCGLESRLFCDGTETKASSAGCGLCP